MKILKWYNFAMKFLSIVGCSFLVILGVVLFIRDGSVVVFIGTFALFACIVLVLVEHDSDWWFE